MDRSERRAYSHACGGDRTDEGVAALRKTVAQKPENADLYQSNLKAAMETTKPFVDDAMQTYDEMIELVCRTDVGKN
jgi:hypothetical protein